MKLQTAENLAKALMHKHGLYTWRFEWDNSRRRFGCCKYSPRVISLSKPLSTLNGIAEVRDTILHEIAHALVGNHNGHNRIWKAKCREIGAKPRRCFDTKSVNMPRGRYVAKCTECGMEYFKQRKPNGCRDYSCRCQSGKDWKSRSLLKYVSAALTT